MVIKSNKPGFNFCKIIRGIKTVILKYKIMMQI